MKCAFLSPRPSKDYRNLTSEAASCLRRKHERELSVVAIGRLVSNIDCGNIITFVSATLWIMESGSSSSTSADPPEALPSAIGLFG